MRKISIVTPSNIDVEYLLAGVGSRAAAFVIDFFIQIASLLLFIVTLDIANTHLLSLTYGTLLAITMVVSFVIHFGYFVLFELVMNGRTPGKAIFKLRTIQDNGMPIEFSHIMIRGLIRATLDMLYIGAFFILFGKKHKRIGDIAAGTIVVNECNMPAFDLIFLDADWPASLPPPAEMTYAERDIVRTFLARRTSLEDNGAHIEKQLQHYFETNKKASYKV